MLSLLVKSLHAFFQVNENSLSSRPISNIFKALKTQFNNMPREIICQFKRYQLPTMQNIPQIFHFMQEITEKELRGGSYKQIETFLDFVTCIFKMPNPFECIDDDEKSNIEQSFISHVLTYFYQPLIHLIQKSGLQF